MSYSFDFCFVYYTVVVAGSKRTTLFGPSLGVFLLHEGTTPYTSFGGMLIIVSVYVIAEQE